MAAVSGRDRRRRDIARWVDGYMEIAYHCPYSHQFVRGFSPLGRTDQSLTRDETLT